MAFSKITLTFVNWESGDPTGETVIFTVDGNQKTMYAVLVRTNSGQFVVAGDSDTAAANFRTAWIADYAGSLFTVVRVGNVVTITATYDGAVFADYSNNNGRVTHVIDNVAYDPPMSLTNAALSEADSSPCAQIKVTLSESDGTAPFTWISPNNGLEGLIGHVPRTGSIITITIEDDNAEQDTIDIFIPDQFTVGDIIGVNVIGDVSGLFGTVVAIVAAKTGLTYTYSLDGANYQASNNFASVFPGSYTLYVKDNYGCVVTYPFTVTLQTLRPPVYRAIPLSNSFTWFENQASIDGCVIQYNGRNIQPNDYKPTRWFNPKYFQPWCFADSPKTQFRSNYDTLVAELINLVDNSIAANLPIVQKSNNLGNRKILDCKIYDRGSNQTGLYFLTGNEYDSGGNIIGAHTLNGNLPDWVKLGQSFTLTGTAQDGVYEVKQIIFDSTLSVYAAVIDRVYTDLSEPVNCKSDATYNKVNYETYEFVCPFISIPAGCYKVKLSMTDSLEEYPDSIWETVPMVVGVNVLDDDLVHIRCSVHNNDGIDYSTGIEHIQRFPGLYYKQQPGVEIVTHDDSTKQLVNLDGSVALYKELSAEFIPMWLEEKLNLYISKKSIYINGESVQFDNPLSQETYPGYSRVTLTGKAKIQNYENYLTDAFNLL